MFLSAIKQYKHMQIIFNNVSDLVFFISIHRNGSFIFEDANDEAVRKMNLPKNFIKKSIDEVMPAHIAETIASHSLDAIQKKRTVSHEDSLKFEGIKRWYESKITPLFKDTGEAEYIIIVTRDITDRKERERELKRTKKELEMIFKHASDVVYTFDEQGDYLSVNPGFTTLFGWAEKEILNDRSITILSEGTQDDFNYILKMIKAGQSISNHESQRVTKSGEIIDVLSSYSPIIEDGEMIGGVAIYKDITKLKKVVKQLRESEERFRQIADFSSDIIRVVDTEGITLYASPSHEKILGMKPAFYLNKSFLTFVHSEDMHLLKNMLEVIIQTKKTQKREFRRLGKRKEIIWLEAIGTPILNMAGEVERIVFVTRDIGKRKEQETELKQLAYHDALTNLPNRRLFDKFFVRAINNSKRHKKLMAVFVLDCDNFKNVNDTYGHDVGDKVIQQFAERIQSNIQENVMVSRMGGDEFQAILPDIDSKEDAISVANQIIKAMEAPFLIGSYGLKLTTSIGISFSEGTHKNKEALIQEADSALYIAKKSGKNTWAIDKESPNAPRWKKWLAQISGQKKRIN